LVVERYELELEADYSNLGRVRFEGELRSLLDRLAQRGLSSR
jgi:hypothetical protein